MPNTTARSIPCNSFRITLRFLAWIFVLHASAQSRSEMPIGDRLTAEAVSEPFATLHIERVFSAPADKVFRAWTEVRWH